MQFFNVENKNLFELKFLMIKCFVFGLEFLQNMLMLNRKSILKLIAF
jgi:hypothetical protein